MHDELRLPTSTFERHDCEPCHRGGRFRAEIPPNEVNAEIEPGCGARRRQHLTVVYVKHVRVNGNSGMTPGELGGGQPVGGGAEPIKDAGCGKNERPTADRRDASTAMSRASNRTQNTR